MRKPWSVTAFTKAIFLLPVLLAGAVEAATDTFTASTTWTAPAGVTSVDVEVWGGGGAGGGQNQNSDGGGGGGGGAYSKVIGVTVIPGNNYTVTVGAGGVGVVAGTGGAGGDSHFINAVTVMAKGGAGGIPSTGTPPAGGAGGAAGAGMGTIKFSGGNGGQGRNNNTGRGGPGGSSAGTAANGTSGPTPWSTLIAAAAPAGGGIGGNGGDTGINGFTPASGNGGGGGGSGEGTNRVGGAGAGGKVTISYATAPTAPTVTTNAATALTASGATLNGTVSSNGADTAVSFEYGLDTAYGNSIAATPPTVLGTTTSATPVSAAVTGLACNTLYHFRVIGNGAGTTNGNDLTFTTSACPPQVTVTPATGGGAIPSNTAPMCGAAGTWTALTGPAIAETVAAQIGLGTIVLSAPAGFEFNTAAAVRILLTGNATASRNINNLPTGTLIVPTVTATTITFTVTEVGTRVNTLTWQSIQVRPTFSTPLASGNITHTGTSAITGVTAGTNFGTLTEVTSTPACYTAPTVTTNAATGVTSAVATLNGTVSSNGGATTVTFEYGLTAAYGASIAATPSPLAANDANIPVSAQVIGLNCNTVFHYRVVATNSTGTTNGLDGTFTTGGCTAPFPATACAATRYNGDLGCTAGDVNITGIALASGSISSCVSGTPVTLNLDLTVNFAVPDRWDVGIFIANDGKLPTKLPANGGASSCSVDVLPTTPPFLDLDGAPQGTLDTCGDGNSSIDDSALGGTVPLGDGVKRMTGVTLPCYASPASGGKLFVPFVVSWDNQKSPIGNLCRDNPPYTANQYPVPNTTSKCNAPASSVSIDVVVLPVITKANGGTEINPGANTIYTVVITNNSGGTLQDVVFKDPAVTDPLTPLTVNSVSCAAAAGATCPAMTSAQMITAMQGAGITIPSTDLPNNGSLTFTINATLSGGATVGSHLINTASATVGGHTSTAEDDDVIVIAPSAAKSFAPSTITEGSSSVLTITLTNPTASAVTGVSFTDTYPAGLVNTASAGGATTCGGTVTAANDGNSLALSGGTIPATGSCTVTVNVTSATAGSYFNSTGTVTHASGTISAASATLTVNVAVFGGFNACDSAAAPNATCTNTTTATDSRITTKIAGSAFNLDLVALKTDGSRNTNYGNNVIVELLDASSGGALDAYNCSSGDTWPMIATLSPNPAFTNPDNGLITVGPFTVPNAYRDVRVRVTNSGGTTKKGCSTDNFAIRPDSLSSLAVKHQDWENPGTGAAGDPALGNLSLAVTGTAVHKAGRNFHVSATAVNAVLATTINYAGSPTAVLTSCTAGDACTATTVGMALPGSAASGVYSTAAATYNEVGAFNLQLQDTTFAAVDASDTPGDCTTGGRYVCSQVLGVGRFVPDHFALAYNAPAFDGACSGGFTYIGQAFNYATPPVITVAAQNFTNVTTAFYTGNWWRITNASLTGKSYTTASGALDTSGITGSDPVISDIGGGVGTLTFGSGTGLFFTRTTPVAPFDAEIALALNVIDADGVTYASNPATFGVATAGNGMAFSGGKGMRYGRLRLINAYGSELLPIRVEARAEYWDGNRWMTNAADTCTSLADVNVYPSNPKPITLSLPAVNAITQFASGPGGVGFITFDKTSAAGSFDIALNLNASSNDTSCNAGHHGGTAASMPWLQGFWAAPSSCNNVAAWQQDPNARIKFGSPKAPYIYLRERY